MIPRTILIYAFLVAEAELMSMGRYEAWRQYNILGTNETLKWKTAYNSFGKSDPCYNNVSKIGHQPFKILDQLERVHEIQTEVMILAKNLVLEGTKITC